MYLRDAGQASRSNRKLIYKERVSWLTSNWSMNCLIPSLSPVRYLGEEPIMCFKNQKKENREILMVGNGNAITMFIDKHRALALNLNGVRSEQSLTIYVS